jgi:hypothetical protein
MLDLVRPFASETTTRESWNHRVSLCLPEARSGMNARPVLTALGRDDAAIRAQDRDGLLFDLGLGAPHADLCVRISDPHVADELAAYVGRPLLEPGNPAIGVILRINPHRVFVSRIGRIEVFQAIPPAHGKSPEGPHTHLMPKLLHHRRTHPATEPVPDGWVPCGHLYPAHPLKDTMGQVRAFDPRRHAEFQSILRTFGEPEIVELKGRVTSALDEGESPDAIALPPNRYARSCIRVTLRQRKAARPVAPSFAAWVEAFEVKGVADEPAEDVYGHS